MKNFVDLIESHFYDGLIFHRVIAGFMIQGGGYDKDMHIHETPAIKGELKVMVSIILYCIPEVCFQWHVQ